MTNKQIYVPDLLMPEDAAKIYVYSPKGLIIGSSEFFISFAIEFEGKKNEKYRIVFSGGPPSPKKLIFWEMQYKRIENIVTGEWSGFQNRLREIGLGMEEWGGYKENEEVEYMNNNRKIIQDTEMLMKWMSMEGLVIMVGTYFQIKVLGKLLNDKIIIW